MTVRQGTGTISIDSAVVVDTTVTKALESWAGSADLLGDTIACLQCDDRGGTIDHPGRRRSHPRAPTLEQRRPSPRTGRRLPSSPVRARSSSMPR